MAGKRAAVSLNIKNPEVHEAACRLAENERGLNYSCRARRRPRRTQPSRAIAKGRERSAADAGIHSSRIRHATCWIPAPTTRFSVTGRRAIWLVIDTSALVALLEDETAAPMLRQALSGDATRLISTVSVLEATCVLGARRGPGAVLELSLFLSEFDLAAGCFRLRATIHRAACLARIRTGPAPGQAQLRRLRILRPGAVQERAAIIHRKRFLADRCVDSSAMTPPHCRERLRRSRLPSVH